MMTVCIIFGLLFAAFAVIFIVHHSNAGFCSGNGGRLRKCGCSFDRCYEKACEGFVFDTVFISKQARQQQELSDNLRGSGYQVFPREDTGPETLNGGLTGSAVSKLRYSGFPRPPIRLLSRSVRRHVHKNRQDGH